MKFQTAAKNNLEGLFPGSSTVKVEKERYLGSLGLQLDSVIGRKYKHDLSK